MEEADAAYIFHSIQLKIDFLKITYLVFIELMKMKKTEWIKKPKFE